MELFIAIAAAGVTINIVKALLKALMSKQGGASLQKAADEAVKRAEAYAEQKKSKPEAAMQQDRRIAELERVVKRAEEESKLLALALEQLQRAHEKPIASKARKSQRKIEPVVAPQASLLPAVMRSGRTGEPITRSLH